MIAVPQERMLMWMLVAILAELALLCLLLLRMQQRRISYLHPGWALVLVSFFYALPVPLLWLLSPEAIGDLSDALVEYYRFDRFHAIVLFFALSMAGFLSAQILISVAGKAAGRTWRALVKLSRGLHRGALRMSIAVACTCAIVLGWMYFSSIGGFMAFLSVSRREAFEQLSAASPIIRYHSLVNGFFMLFAVYVLSRPRRSRVATGIFWISLASYCALELAKGTRLTILVLLLGLGAVLFAIRPSAVFSRKRVLVVAMVAVAVLFSWFGMQRSNVAAFLQGRGWYGGTEAASWMDLFPLETITAYVPGLVMLDVEDQGFNTPYWRKPIPSTVSNLLGWEKPDTLSRAMAIYMVGPSGQPVYTVTLPTDIYLGTESAALVFAISLLIYLAFHGAVSAASQRGYMGIGLAAILFMQTWYVVRVEFSNWFSKLWQDVLVFAVFWLLYKLVRGALPAATGRAKSESRALASSQDSEWQSSRGPGVQD